MSSRTLIRLFLMVACALLVACASKYQHAPELDIVDLKWRTAIGLGDRHRPNLTQPIVTKRAVYVASAIGYVYALDTNSGARLWSQFLTDAEISGHMLLEKDELYVPTASGNLWILDSETGEVKVRYDIPATTARPMITRGLIVLQTVSGAVVALSKETGERRWLFAGSSGAGVTTLATSALYAVGAFVLLGTRDGFLFLLDANTGRQLAWSYRVASANSDHTLARITSITSIFSLQEKLIALAQNGGGVSLDARTLEPHWHNQTLASRFSPAKVGPHVIAVHSDTKVYAFSLATGEVVWETQLADYTPALTQAVVLGNHVVVGTQTGRVCVLHVTDGALQSCDKMTPHPLSSFVTSDGEIAYMTDSDGFVFALRVSP